VQCPNCKTDRAHRTHRRGLKDYAASLFGFYPYRCHDCEHRFFHSYRTAEEPAREPSSTGKEVRVTRGHRAARQRRRELLLYGLALLVFLAFLYYISRYHGAPAGG